MSEEYTKTEVAADTFLTALQDEENARHAWLVLATVVIMALEGQPLKAKKAFLDLMVEETGVGPAIKQALMNREMKQPAIKPETETQHKQLVYLGGWNPAEQEPN